MMKKSLKAWEPFDFSLRCFYELHICSDFRSFPNWDIYWLSAITSVRSIWHVLSEQDLKGDPLRHSIFMDYRDKNASWEILQSFARNQRDRTIKRWDWDVMEQEFMTGKRRDEEFAADHTSIIFSYSTPDRPVVNVDENLQGEDPIRLLGIALDFLHRDLSYIEIALNKNILRPFSGGVSERQYSEAPFFEDAPNYYR
jgi:hypothetical protein